MGHLTNYRQTSNFGLFETITLSKVGYLPKVVLPEKKKKKKKKKNSVRMSVVCQ
jgi:hypothetical protein